MILDLQAKTAGKGFSGPDQVRISHRLGGVGIAAHDHRIAGFGDDFPEQGVGIMAAGGEAQKIDFQRRAGGFGGLGKLTHVLPVDFFGTGIIDQIRVGNIAEAAGFQSAQNIFHIAGEEGFIIGILSGVETLSACTVIFVADEVLSQNEILKTSPAAGGKGDLLLLHEGQGFFKMPGIVFHLKTNSDFQGIFEFLSQTAKGAVVSGGLLRKHPET